MSYSYHLTSLLTSKIAEVAFDEELRSQESGVRKNREVYCLKCVPQLVGNSCVRSREKLISEWSQAVEIGNVDISSSLRGQKI